MVNCEGNEDEGDATLGETILKDVKVSDRKGEIQPDVDVCSMLAHAGDFGRYQILLMVLFSLVNVLSAFHYFAQTFITIQPADLRCDSINGDSNLTDILNVTQGLQLADVLKIRPKNGDKCKGYYLDMTEIITEEETVEKSVWKLEECTAFDYDRHFGYESIVTELDWVCKDAWKAALGQSMYFVGAVGGTFMMGIAADKWGRVKALIAAFLFAILGNTMTILSSGLELFAVSRFIAGLATDTNFVMMYIIVMEYIRPSMRTFGLNICIGVFYCLGCSVVPWLAVGLETWRKFLMSVSVPMVLVPFYYFILPESASWLLTKGRADKALEGFLRIAKINGKVIPDEVVARFQAVHKDGGKPPQTSLHELFKTPNLRRKMSILVFKTMTLTLCYDAISRNVNISGTSPFVIFSLGSLTVFPACLVILTLQDKIGRKGLFFIAVLLSAFLTSSSGLMHAFLKDAAILSTDLMVHMSIGLSVTARLCVVIAFNSGSQYAAELIPTVIRGRGVALIHVVGYAASFLSPLLLYLSRFWQPLPDLLLGLLCFICASLTLLLPETLGRTLPASLNDGEVFGEEDRPCDFACCGGRTSRRGRDENRDEQ
ncbi:organic cation transporter protein-like isoform X1 [Neodiprion virginianus]|uniref:organic cation transporter protein-like isoform X1 n=2 Tax=Neodiprion virginianus TaxID=2961670 RepID=UPI001EE6DA94|nr:organic cation transporter protein-like isoform X1 [Neodiprion virginianus]XP_046621485.1 organic cation transporter protein-like isoform X1 [Neodiprion virginianus]XP_046621486.1 organic cation transporter protein-like isoform X1 [Neodiprion virginianus]XP_046621487.1 organic cation transporter protein-like isoform X1 [Neodiprion virginianus]XP_046621489.1 organic cation transporter protein-like isoform X1 [Neodiprion virginianus]